MTTQLEMDGTQDVNHRIARFDSMFFTRKMKG